ncbi:hypothetical protein CROQUDRAFT_45322, partial [Cronartium quercuum f. sp. fusiforme G11]
DSNLHSPIWNPSHSITHDKNSDLLLETMTQWGLNLCSPTGIPTYGIGSAMTKGMSIDLVFMNDLLDDHLQTCMVDKEHATNHLSDHQALITTLTTYANSQTHNKKDQGTGER